MGKIKGQNFRILLGTGIIPEETNCSVTLNNNTEDNSTKDHGGLYTSEQVVSSAWQVSVDTIQSEIEQIRTVIETFSEATPVGVGWDKTTGADNSTPANESFSRSGNAILNDFTMNFNDRETVSTSLQFQGTGALS